MVLSSKNSESYTNNEYEDKNLKGFLYNSNFLIDESYDAKQDVLKMHNDEVEQADILTLIIAPTLSCNFDCTYCFEDNQDMIMGTNVEEQILKLASEIGNKIKMLQIIWYGGEPLLNTDTIIRMSKYFIEHCCKHNIHYSSIMITNGLLLDKNMITSLELCKINSYQITIDGNKLIHNRRRMLKNGDGTFDRIIANIRENSDSIFSIRINIDRENINSLNEFMNIIDSLNLKNITISIAKVENNSLVDFSNKEYGEFLLRELKLSTKKTFKNFHLPSLKKVSCSFQSNNSIISDPLGDMYSCWASTGCKDKSYANIFNIDSLLFSKVYGTNQHYGFAVSRVQIIADMHRWVHKQLYQYSI